MTFGQSTESPHITYVVAALQIVALISSSREARLINSGMSKNRTRNPGWKEMRRYRALELEREGWTHEEIAEALDVSTRAVRKWMKAVREEGEVGLQARPHPGATPKIAAAE